MASSSIEFDVDLVMKKVALPNNSCKMVPPLQSQASRYPVKLTVNTKCLEEESKPVECLSPLGHSL